MIKYFFNGGSMLEFWYDRDLNDSSDQGYSVSIDCHGSE